MIAEQNTHLTHLILNCCRASAHKITVIYSNVDVYVALGSRISLAYLIVERWYVFI